MSYKACIQGGVTSGVISQDQANEALELFDTLYESYNKQMGPGPAASKATTEANKALNIAVKERKRVRLKQIQAQVNLKKRINEAEGGNIYSAFTSVFDFDVRSRHPDIEGLKDTVRGMAMSRMTDVLVSFRRNFLSSTRNKATQKHMLTELFGGDSGNAAAKQLAKAWAEATEYLRLRANAAGSTIPFLEGWGLPQRHNSISVRAAGYEAWRDEILPLLNVDKMIDRKTQLPFKVLSNTDPEGRIQVSPNLEAALRDAYESISMEGANKRQAGKYRGSGAIGKKYNHHRFLVFKDGDSWMQYNQKFGMGEPFDIMMGHIDAMSRDIAIMEILGPNPNAGFRFLEDTLDSFMLKRMEGKTPTKQRFLQNQLSVTKNRMNVLYDWVSDKAQTPGSEMWAYALEGVRNNIHSAFLGSTTLLAAPTDINFNRFTRAFNGLPQTKILNDYIKFLMPLKGTERTKLAARAGLVADMWTTMAAGQARYVGEVNGPEITRRMADIVMRVSGLSPWTQAGRLSFGMQVFGTVADNAGKTFDQLDPKFQRMMDNYGIGSDKWDIIRSTPEVNEDGATFIMPTDLEARTDIDPSLARQVATDYLRMVNSESDFAVPTASTRAKSTLLGNTKPGTFAGEVLRSTAMYKNFGFTLFNTHLMRGATQTGFKNKAVYLGAFTISATLAAAFAMQMKEIAKGRDPLPMVGEGADKFWWSALLTSGGLSVYADFVFSKDATGRSGLEQTFAGPVIGFAADTIDLTIMNMYQAYQGKDTRFGSELVKYVKRYMPGSSLWYWRTAIERNLFDSLQMMVDPKTHNDFKRLRRKRARDFDQSYWWDLGERAPSRAPDLGKAFGL